MNNKITDEYVNYMGIYQRLNYIPFFDDVKLRTKMFRTLQLLLEDRILYRYQIKSPPYHGYNPVDPNEHTIEDFFVKFKSFMEVKNAQSSELYQKFDRVKDLFIDLVNNKKTKFAKLYDSDNTILATDQFVKYRKIKIMLDDRLRYLLSKMNKKRFVRMILRYLGYGITGHHCSIPYNVYEFMYTEFGVHGEGFSSPLNSKLIEMPDCVFCTLFRDTDKRAGGLGPFSAKALIQNPDKNWCINPPYMAPVMSMVYKQVMKAFRKIERPDLLVIVIFPMWEDDESYIAFSKSKYLAKLVTPPEGKHYMNCNGRSVYMKGVVNVAFFLCRDKTAVTDEKIDKMMEVWNRYIDGSIQQSSFSTPVIEK